MWEKVLNTNYYLAFNSNLELSITDFVSVWCKQFNNSSFLACLKESNSRMEIEEQELLEKGKRMLQHPNNLKKADLREERMSLHISLSVMDGCPIRFIITLTAGSKELFFQKVTQQLLLTIRDLRSSENKLRLLLQKKDKEIEEYKCEGGEIALRHLKTVPFNDEAHMQSHQSYQKQFGSSGIDDSLLQERSNDIQAVSSSNSINSDPTIVKQEPTSIKTEEPSSTVKSESPVRVKQEDIVKSEPQSVSQLSGVSPRKKQKRKLNI